MNKYECPNCGDINFEEMDINDEREIIIKSCYCNECDISFSIEYTINEIEIIK